MTSEVLRMNFAWRLEHERHCARGTELGTGVRCGAIDHAARTVTVVRVPRRTDASRANIGLVGDT